MKGEDVMAGTKSYLTQELTRFFEAVWLELPAVAGKVLLGLSDETELREAGWKAYYAGISLANELTNAVYSDRVFGEVTGQMMESALRVRQIGGAMAAASFANLWPSIGLPTHNEMIAVREELAALREELAAHSTTPAVSEDSARMDAQGPFQPIWKGPERSNYRATNDNGSTARGTNHGKRYVAA